MDVQKLCTFGHLRVRFEQEIFRQESAQGGQFEIAAFWDQGKSFFIRSTTSFGSVTGGLFKYLPKNTK
jgi:hypothetical protein